MEVEEETGRGGSRGERAPAPALFAAGAMAAGGAAGGAAGAGTAGEATSTALFVIALATLAILRSRGWASGIDGAAGASWRAVRATAAAGCALAVLAGARAHGEAAEVTAAPGSPLVLEASRRPSRREGLDVFVGRGRAACGAPAAARLQLAAGSARAGDVIRPLALEAPLWARPPIGARAERRGAAATAARPRADEVERLASAAPSRVPGPLRALAAAPSFARARGIEAAGTHPRPAVAALLRALLFGDTSALDPALVDLFTRTGTRHMLALSGLHVGLVGLMLARPLAAAIARIVATVALLARLARGLPPPARPPLDPAWATAAIALLFVPLAGHGAPASRAALALGVAVLGPRLPRALGAGPRRPSAENLLGAALALEVALDPLAPLRPGVQLSYLATIALVALAPRAIQRTREWIPGLGPVARVGRTGRARWALGCAMVDRARGAAAAGLATSVVASLATLPIVWTVFGEYAIVGLVATPLALPALAGSIALGWAFVVAPEGSAVERLMADGAAGAAGAMLAILEHFDRWPGSPTPLPLRPLLLIAALSWLGLVALAAGTRAGRMRAALAGAALAGALLLPRAASEPAGPEVHVVDVGDGLAVLARAADGTAVLLDAGSADRIGVASAGVGPLLRALEVRELHVALSHGHADHARDLGWVARRYSARTWIGAPAPPGWGAPADAGARRVRLERGAVEALRTGALRTGALRVVAVRGGPFEGNEGSLALDLRWDGPGAPDRRPVRVVLCGDAEDFGLAAMLRGQGGALGRGPLEPGPIDALLLPHHGSDSRHLGDLLDHLRPLEVWISASDPTPPALAECVRRGLPVRVTGAQGPFTWRPAGDRDPSGNFGPGGR